jgi:predicted PurR-regulated permease PerM
MALVAFLAYNCYINHGHLTERLLTKAVTLAFIFGIVFYLFVVLTEARQHAFKEAQQTLIKNLRRLALQDWVKRLASELVDSSDQATKSATVDDSTTVASVTSLTERLARQRISNAPSEMPDPMSRTTEDATLSQPNSEHQRGWASRTFEW